MARTIQDNQRDIIEEKEVHKSMKNKFIIKKIKGITVDVRSKHSLYITMGKWVVYIDNSTNEKIIDTWQEHD
jgi:peptide methionine sulfoxide reductase MsrB